MKYFITIVLAGIAFLVWVVTWPLTPAGRETVARQAQQKQDDRLPRKTSEAGGCEVWAFKPADRWLYFTRCDVRTTTANTWQECRTTQAGRYPGNACTTQEMNIGQETK